MAARHRALLLATAALASSLRPASAIPSALDAAPAALRATLASYGHPLARAGAMAPKAPGVYGASCSPLDYGADPLGLRDSAPALAACVQLCVNYSRAIDHLGHFPGDSSFGNGLYIANAGGCMIDLGGGEYMLSSPVRIPQFIANINIAHGSLVADNTPGVFPTDSFLIEVGIPGSCKVPQGSCNLHINFDNMFFDGRQVASALQINSVMGTTVSASYFLNFSSYGIQINGGHEVMIEHCWLGETNFDFPFEDHPGVYPKAIGIQQNGNDHYVRDTIVFSSKIGVEVNGAADYISGTHVWFPDNQAIRFFPQGVMAFHVTGGGNRFDGCYIDGSRAVFVGSGLTQNTWVNGFECCAGYGGPHGIELVGNKIGPGLIIKNNIFGGGNIYYNSTGTTGPLEITGTDISGNSFQGGGGGSRASMTLTQAGATQWAFNFCSQLIFPTIARVVSVTVTAASGFPTAVARPPTGCSILIETSEPVTGDVSVTVDSSTLSADFV